MATSTPQRKVAIIGGSIAGCAAAIAAHKAGCEVTLYERSHGDLAERGFGISLPPALVEKCVEGGYLDADVVTWDIYERHWFTLDSKGDHLDLWTSPLRMVAFNWGLLWKSLRSHVPDGVYRQGHKVTALTATDSGATLTVDGVDEHYDLVVGADGYRSIVRSRVAGETTPGYSGYVTWRGVVDASALTGCDDVLKQLETGAATAGFDGGHVMYYPIPGPDGRRRINWLVYACPPESVDMGLSMSYTSADLEAAVTPHFNRLIENVSPQWRQIIQQTPDEIKAFQPIFDLELDRCAAAPFVLAGDASTITRPHTASGGTKAIEDALCLEKVLRESDSIADAVATYDKERNEVGNELVRLSRRLGRAQVLETPDWAGMDPQSMSEWVAETVAGHGVYIYAGNTTDE